jgi:hypothetical protein
VWHRKVQSTVAVFPVEVVLAIHKVVIVTCSWIIPHPLPNSCSHANPIAHYAATTRGFRLR